LSEREIVESTVYRLVEPGKFKEQLFKRQIQEGEVDITPHLASVCHADLRYFNGERRPEALAEKLPMALFHEGIGIVNQSKHPDFKTGDRVVIVPNIPKYILNQTDRNSCCYICQDHASDNYCVDGVFLASGFDGVAQSHLVLPGEAFVPIPDNVDDNIALLAELCSVSLYAINRAGVRASSTKKVAVFGDGPVGYLTAASLRFVYHIPQENLLVFGADEEKLKHFKGFAKTSLVHDYDFSQMEGVKTIFECTGGKFSSSAINQAIDLIDREGTIVLMGVTEELVPLNTRDILEKGLRLIGSSRSTSNEFKQLMEAFKNEEFVKVLNHIVPNEYISIANTKDLEDAMVRSSKYRGWKKTYLAFNWE